MRIRQATFPARLLPTAYVVRGKVMFWHVSVHPSICLSTPRRVPQPGPVGGYTSQVQLGGTPAGGTPPCIPLPVRPDRGVPHLGYPPVRPGWEGVPWWGYPTLGTPHQTWLGVPQWGVPHLRYTPIRPGWGVPQWGLTQLGVGYPTSGTPHQTCMGRYPTSGTPLSDLARGYPDGGYPTLVPPVRRGRWGTLMGVTWQGYPNPRGWGTPPQVPPSLSDLAGGGTLMGGTPPQVVLDTSRSVCLLRSRRRTFLFLHFLTQSRTVECCFKTFSLKVIDNVI